MGWDKTRVLVTGAGGFVGSHLVEALVEQGAKVRALVHYNSRSDWGNLELLDSELRKHIEIVPGDVCDAWLTREAVRGMEVVFHLAALIAIPYSYHAPASYLATNAQGTLNVLQACRQEGVGVVVHTSTSEVYGSALYTPIDEKHPLQAQSPYSASKIAGDKLAESFYRSFSVPIVTVRPFNVYGPRQSARAIIPTIVTQALVGEELDLGLLSTIRDFTYVGDTVAGFIRAAETQAAIGETINIGSGQGLSISDLVERIGVLLRRDLRVRYDEKRARPEESEVDVLVCDRSKAESILGWTPQCFLEQGLARTIDWFATHLERYKPSIYNV